MPTHSPLPWFRSGLVTADDGWEYVSIGPYELHPRKDEFYEDEIANVSGINHDALANADLIVRAVNSHAALLEACERIIAADDAKSLSAIVDAMPALRAAVQLATGGSDDQ